MARLVLLLLCAWLAALSHAALPPPDIDPDYYQNKKEVNSDLTIYWSVSNLNIEVALACKCTGWLGWGLSDHGSTMVDVDMVIGRVGRTGIMEVKDYWSTAYQTPQVDSAQGGFQSLISYNGQRKDGVTSIKFTRKMDTTDSKTDVKIVPGQKLTVLWAYNWDSDDINEKHTVFGAFDAILFPLTEAELARPLAVGNNNDKDVDIDEDEEKLNDEEEEEEEEEEDDGDVMDEDFENEGQGFSFLSVLLLAVPVVCGALIYRNYAKGNRRRF